MKIKNKQNKQLFIFNNLLLINSHYKNIDKK